MSVRLAPQDHPDLSPRVPNSGRGRGRGTGLRGHDRNVRPAAAGARASRDARPRVFPPQRAGLRDHGSGFDPDEGGEMTTAQANGGAQAGEEAAGSARRTDIDWVAAERSPEFRELIAKKRAFVLPATVFFLAWYFGFIVLAGYAPDFMGGEFLADGLTVGLRARAHPVPDGLGPRLGLHPPRRPGVRPAGATSGRRRRSRARPATSGGPCAARPLRPRRRARWRRNDALRLSQRDRPCGLRGGRRHHAGGDLLRLEARVHGHRLLGRRARPHRAAERLRDRRRLHVGRVVPRHRRPDLPVRIRRLPVLRRLPGGLPHRALPARRADAQQRQVHDRRRARRSG